MMAGWIGVDLDGTLARYEGWKGIDHVGAPIPQMVNRVKRWLDEGKQVKIFTARVYVTPGRDLVDVLMPIQEWCRKHIGQVLEVTNVKDFNMVELWDDRCVQVIPNTGDPVFDPEEII